MEAQIIALEKFAVDTRERLTRIETRLNTFATKEDLHRELHSMTWKLFSGALTGATALVGLVYWMARNIPYAH